MITQIRWFRLYVAFCTLWSGSILAGCGHLGHHKTSEKAAAQAPAAIAQVRTATGTVHPKLELAGILAPFQNVAISSQLTEPALAVNVVQGQTVTAGTILATFDTADLQAQLLAAQGTLANAQATARSAQLRVTQARFTARTTISSGANGLRSANASVAQARATLQNDLRNLRRDQSLVSQGFIPQQTIDQAQTLVLNDEQAVQTALDASRIASTTASVNGNAQNGLPAATIAAAATDAQAAAAAVTTATGQVRNIQAQIAKAQLVAPVSGVIVNRNLNPGEYPAGRTLFTLQEIDKMYANLNASSSAVFAISRGAPVQLTVSGARQNYHATISAILGQVSPGSTNFTAQAVVENPQSTLQAGMPVSATITLPALTGVRIPQAAFLDDTQQSVYLVRIRDGRQTAHSVPVTVIAQDDHDAVIRGLGAGQAIVANGQLGLTEGEDVGPLHVSADASPRAQRP